MSALNPCCIVFLFNDTATTEIYTLSLHDALPISNFYAEVSKERVALLDADLTVMFAIGAGGELRKDTVLNSIPSAKARSEEHTSELQSRQYLVCRLLLEKKTNNILTTLVTTRVHG